MNKLFNNAIVEVNGVRAITGGGTGASNDEQARVNLKGIGYFPTDTSYVKTIRALTVAEYDALGSFDPNTIYFIL
jgi:hypothetical protein